jgi:Reverse transcriptase (RNA-dependent DNA polymerase)
MTGDIFRPTMITNAAILRLSTLAGVGPIPLSPILDAEPLLTDPMPPYPLDPHRGVQDDKQMAIQQSESSESDIVMADAVNIDVDPRGQTVDTSHDNDMTYEVESSQNLSVPLHEDALIEVEDDLIEVPDRAISQAEELVDARDTPKYNFRTSTTRKHVYSTLSIKAARNLYGHELADKATRDELITCIEKDVWECLDPSYVVRGAIPSRMFLTPKTLPNGELDRVKGRIVAGGHRQDRTLYEDKEISSPTVALTSVLTMAALAAHERRHVMTLDHKAAYLNAKMLGPPVVMMLPAEVAEMLCNIDSKYSKFLRPDKKIAVKLKKALYGCVQSAVLWYNELTSTLEELGFIRNPYDTCSFSRPHQDSYDRILVYVDDLFLSSASEDRLNSVADVLRKKYDAVTFKTGTQHDFLGIHWDFSTLGEVSLSMEGYINDIISKYNITKECNTPATDRLFHTTADSPLLTSDKKDNFRSCVMTIYYIAKRTLPVLLISFCGTKVLAPTEEDQTKLERILSFIL